MAGSTTKKTIVLRFDREPLSGFVNPQTFLAEHGVELLSASGSLLAVPYRDVKAVCFVRDFDADPPPPNKLVFANRPKAHGLWVRLVFRDGQQMEGLIANNLLLFEPAGISVTPPEGVWNSQKIFVPRQALSDVQVLGVVGSPLRQPRKKEKPTGQMKFFE
ncbi:MAG: hypothetical protein IT160_00740 [Bryobacterales bacterium]|nr:hypothetical protein [Bryobacterales bacterium]